MERRDFQLRALRPEIPSAKVTYLTGSDEQFQNEVLRPVVKLQSSLLLASFRNYANKHKGVFFTLPPDRRMDYIENAIQKDIKFRNALKGMVIGQFTLDEFDCYIQNSSMLNKRMMRLVIGSIQEQDQLLEMAGDQELVSV